MLIGRTDDPQNPCRVAAFEADRPLGSGSRNPSGPAATGRTKQAGHTTAIAPGQISLSTTLASSGPSTHAGNERLRQLLVLGATAVIRHAKPGRASAWLLALLARRPRKLAAVALANKMARIVWAMMTSGEPYRQNTPAAV
jgi:hypothetical protein